MDLVYSGGGNPRAEIARCLTDIDEAGGGVLHIVGEHVIDWSVEATVADPFIHFGDTGSLVLDEGLSVPALVLRTPVPYTGTARLVSPRIDCSRGRYIGGASSSTAISPQLYGRLEVYNPYLYGGADWRDMRADSGIAPLGIVSGFISGGLIEGFADLGIYVTGGWDIAPHDEHLLIDGLKIKGCRQGIDVKRRYRRVTAQNCKIVNTEVAYRMSWVGNESNGGSPIPPGLRMDVVGGLVRNARIAFQPEGPAVLDVDETKVDARDLLARNQGGVLKGNCRVDGGSTAVKEENLTVAGTTYRPTTKLRVST